MSRSTADAAGGRKSQWNCRLRGKHKKGWTGLSIAALLVLRTTTTIQTNTYTGKEGKRLRRQSLGEEQEEEEEDNGKSSILRLGLLLDTHNRQMLLQKPDDARFFGKTVAVISFITYNTRNLVKWDRPSPDLCATKSSRFASCFFPTHGNPTSGSEMSNSSGGSNSKESPPRSSPLPPFFHCFANLSLEFTQNKSYGFSRNVMDKS